MAAEECARRMETTPFRDLDRLACGNIGVGGRGEEETE
jgi:hypothetical protein